MKRSKNPSLNTLQELLQQLGNLIMRGIQHGHFDYQITGSSNANGRRNIVLKAGITHRYDMNISDLPSNLPSIATFYHTARTLCRSYSNRKPCYQPCQDHQHHRCYLAIAAGG